MPASHGDHATPRAPRKAFSDHWSFLLGEIAVHSLVVLLLTGVYLTLFFVPSLKEVTYDGSYGPLQGVRMSEAYASTLHIGFDVRGGSLIRQIHHLAAVIFTVAVLAHLVRNFFTGAFRKAGDLNWLIGVALLMLVMLNGLSGYTLPDDLRSGTGLRILEGAVSSIPLIGSYLTMILSGGEYVPRLYMIHILLIPGMLLALITLHAVAHPLQRARLPVIATARLPRIAARTLGTFLCVSGATALMAVIFKPNPVWLFGPYQPGRISAESPPYPYAGWLDGPLSLMPGWELTAWGQTLSLNVLVPALVVPGLLFAGLAAYPPLERRFLRDDHRLPARAGTGAAAIAFYGVLWAAGGHDVIAETFGVPLFWTIWFFRVAIIYVPLFTFAMAYLACFTHESRKHPVPLPRLETG
ncbi:cytochrome b N-terminal domain-containing protein [Actinomadura sp. 7K507]|uniref:cytochrome b n=1 Tax=Actinomadura sp. 7K507 TaxID=2530365 RepID=UPI00104B51D6|nr:cytochrome b N-terminal domain-containing protein [Actinomadura sp. 7K507]TDC86018.1 ubiquinol-cytochrome c reductase cytochrome b subunit [Actinomadura sp. 7K507]